MYPSYLSNYIIKESQNSLEAFWKLEKQRAFLNAPILVVLNESDEYIGIITPGALSEIIMHIDEPMALTAGELCNKSSRALVCSANNRTEAMAVFADNEKICAIPVIDDKKMLVDIIFRQQVFYKDFYLGMIHYGNNKFTLPYMAYARNIYRAAELAGNLGYDSFSVIEFGVGGGNGLVACEFHIKEIARLFNLKIELYGFDTGEGLPDIKDYRDIPYMWGAGDYRMDYEKLKGRLQFAKLILGDIKTSAKEFMDNAAFAPIGVMLVDVDYYSSTVPVLNILHEPPEKFLPRVHMYFDDVGGYLEHLGENLAITEFNAGSEDVKISRQIQPQGAYPYYCCAHLYKHEKYNTTVDMLSHYKNPTLKLY